MKLQHNQARRFERIFDALLSFTAKKRGVLEALRSNNRMTSGQISPPWMPESNQSRTPALASRSIRG